MLTQVDTDIANHGASYTAKAQPAVEEAAATVLPLSKGVIGGGSWKEHMSASAEWLEIKTVGTPTLAAIDPQLLSSKTRLLHSVLPLHSTRC